MATFQLRPKMVGAKRYTGKNAQEIVEFLATGTKNKYTVEYIQVTMPNGIWAVKDGGNIDWMDDDVLRSRYKLTVQGENESYSDDYR